MIASNLDSEEMVNFTKIRDWEVFHKLPLKPYNFVNRVADKTEIINVGENDREVTVMKSNEDTGVGRAGFEAEFE